MELPPQPGAGPESTGNEDEEHEVLREDGPRIYVASLSDYNAGILHGEWVRGRSRTRGTRRRPCKPCSNDHRHQAQRSSPSMTSKASANTTSANTTRSTGCQPCRPWHHRTRSAHSVPGPTLQPG